MLRESDVLGPSVTATFLAVLTVYERSGRATIREVALAAGNRSLANTHIHLRKLRDAGLIDWRDGAAGTMRPTVRMPDGPWRIPVLASQRLDATTPRRDTFTAPTT